MKNNNKTSLLQSVVNRALAGDGEGSLNWENVLYALDKDLDYSKTVYEIHKSKLIKQDKIESVLLDILKGGPSWVHANVIISSPAIIVLTLVAGKAVGNPSPSINVSYEKNKSIRVIGNETGHI